MSDIEKEGQRPQFSILVPVYNAESYLAQCLDAIQNQTFPDFEAIILNDGSTDGSGEIADAYAMRDPRFVVVSQKNEGLPKARITLMRQAKGNYILFSDADDWLRADALEKINEALLREKADLLVFDFSKVYGRQGEQRIEKEPPLKERSGFIEKEEMVRYLTSSFSLNPLWNKVVSRQWINLEIDPRCLTITQGDDLVVGLPWLFRAKRIFYLREALYYYCCDISTSVTGKVLPYRYRMVNETRNLILEYLNKESVKVDWSAFADQYFLSMNYCMRDIVFGISDRKERNRAFGEMKKSPVYQRLFPYAKLRRLPIRYRIQSRCLICGAYGIITLLYRFEQVRKWRSYL